MANPAVAGGFTMEEGIEMALAIGAHENVRVVELCEMNPAIECFITFSSVLQLFYHVLISQSMAKSATSS